MGEFVGLHFTEAMIDHLEIESIVHHVESEEARLQIKTYGLPSVPDGMIANNNIYMNNTMRCVKNQTQSSKLRSGGTLQPLLLRLRKDKQNLQISLLS